MKTCDKAIIQVQYRPSLWQKTYQVYEAMDLIPGPGTPVEKLNNLMEMIYNKIVFPVARQYNLPIVDCARAFDIQDTDLYSHQIEPSKKGGQLIADMVSYVVKNHDFANKHSVIYYKKNGQMITDLNDGKMPWKIDN